MKEEKVCPDTLNAEIFQTWVINRRSWLQIEIDKYKTAKKEVGYEIEDRDYQILMSDEFVRYLLENAVPVGGRFAKSTKFACLIDFKKEFREILVQRIYSQHDEKTKKYFDK